MHKQKMTKLGSQNLHFHKNDLDGTCSWPQNKLKWVRGSERPAAHTQQKLTKVPPLHRGGGGLFACIPEGKYNLLTSTKLLSQNSKIVLSCFTSKIE